MPNDTEDVATRHQHLIQTTRFAANLKTNTGIQALSGMALAWPDPVIRLTLLQLLPSYLPSMLAVDAIAKLAEDPDDYVCMVAMRISGNHKIQEVIPYLEKIVGLPSRTANDPGGPVGRGAAVVHEALTNIFDSQDDDFREESFYREHGFRRHRIDHELTIDEAARSDFRASQPDSMKLIPQGFSNVGVNRFDVPDASFRWKKAVPERACWLPDFYIDTDPVTNSEYDEFCRATVDTAETYIHPLHPESKLTFDRNTLGDARFGPDHPVTGIDWFDAFAYASWAGKSLPTAYQWEKAARGPTGSVWPWGNKWDGSKCCWAETSFDTNIESISKWRSLLAAIDFSSPETATSPVDRQGLSPYGVRGMVGNAWEFTSTDYDTGYGFSPASESRTGRAPAVVLKGGSWTSMPGQMFPSYWGQDAPFCRHNEIGFRCVANLPSKALQTDESFYYNTALYF